MVVGSLFDLANQLTLWGSTSMTYDNNGNTLNDGTNAYVWDARSRLVSANSNQAAFTYDPLGRRASKTFMSATTGFVYDGPNPVQELQGSTITANLLTGGLDERFLRTDATGSYSYLTDALGSTEALTTSTGAEQATYTYAPYGSFSITGATSNSYDYTGRESDGLGLEYFRARYYNPKIGRFISEDPAGFAGSGPDLYQYAGDDPIDFTDPFGLDRGSGGSDGQGPDSSGPNPFECASNAANKVSLAGVAHWLGVPKSGVAGFATDALGGNVFSGATDLLTSIATGQSGEGDDAHSVFYNMGQSVVAGPTQGFNSGIKLVLSRTGGKAAVDAFEDSVWSKSLGDMASDAIASPVGSALESGGELTTLFGEASTTALTGAEYATGVGELKLGYDAATYGAALIGCWTGIL